MRIHQASLMIVCLFLAVRSAGALGDQEDCISFCGKLNISYPFRLKGDRPTCGNQSYELTCNNNQTIIDFHSGKYYVESISYVNRTIQIIDVGLAGGGCALPSKILPADYTNTSDALYFTPTSALYFTPTSAVSFVNCSQEIQSNTYTPIPCLSGKRGFVYITTDSSVRYLAPSCRFVAMVPSTTDDLADNTEALVFKLLQKGFILNWGHGACSPASYFINYCIVETRKELKNDLKHKNLFYRIVSPLAFQKNFFNCLDSYDVSWLNPSCPSMHATFQLVKVKNVLLDGVAFIVVFAVLAGLLGRILFLPLTICGFLAYKYLEMQVPIDSVEKFLRNQEILTPTRYSYMEIITMARHFKEKLGEGGFGSVYKGKLPGGFQVAVKMLGNSKCNGDDFISEVSTIGRIHHVNVVRLIGYSSEGSKRALVYEYLAKGSLDKYIFSKDATIQRPFTWDKLTDIAVGVARGIDYLHSGCDMQILHFDIKPHNILLDNCFNPKVSDFGLAKLFPKDYSMVALSAARGTIGYIAPELISRSFGAISYKSDVYSFGMLLMEMAGGRRNVQNKGENSSQHYYPSWIYDQLEKQTIEVHDIVEDVSPIGEVEKKLSIVGLWCIQTRPSDRPSMSRVVEMLQANVNTLQMPPKPFHSADIADPVYITDISMEASSTTLSVTSEDESLN